MVYDKATASAFESLKGGQRRTDDQQSAKTIAESFILHNCRVSLDPVLKCGILLWRRMWGLSECPEGRVSSIHLKKMEMVYTVSNRGHLGYMGDNTSSCRKHLVFVPPWSVCKKAVNRG